MTYLRLFTVLGLLKQGSRYCSKYIALLRQELGLEMYVRMRMMSLIMSRVCNLGLRFFYLSKIRKLRKEHTENPVNVMGYVIIIIS